MSKEKIKAIYNQALFDGIKADLVSFAEVIEDMFFSNKPPYLEGIISENSSLPIYYKKFKHPDETVKLAYMFSINDDPIGTIWWGEGDLQSTKEDLEKTADTIINVVKRHYAFKVFNRNELKGHIYGNTISEFMESIGYSCKLVNTDDSLLISLSRPEDKIEFDLSVKDGGEMLFKPLGGPLEYAINYLVKFVIIAIVNGRYKQDEAFEI